VDEHHQAVYRYAYRLTGRSADAEDLTQQVFLIAHTHAHTVRAAHCVRAWLFAVLRSCYSRLLRRRQPLPAASVELDVNLLAADEASDAVDPAQLQAAIDELADEFKIVVLMFYFEYLPYRQIAEQLDVPIGTVMSRLARAKAHLRRRLFEPADHVSVPAPKSPLLSRIVSDDSSGAAKLLLD
jgi:RNA polymerase sigma-70 factor (ECF subfamily)